MNRFFNHPKSVVDEILGGLAQTADVTLSAPGLGVRIIARADWKKDKVALISGGGAGHEPAHAGFVGEGMLTAAVSGELFASPSVDAVLAGIRHVTGPAGCLLIVKNYTGDRLNFGLAAERARTEGFKVEVVIVADDIALPESVKPRGIAGTVLVHKYAGALAAEGLSLEDVHKRVSVFAAQPASLGLALSGCDVPGQSGEHHGPELGLGIHNESGARPVAPTGARDAMSLVLAPLLAEAGRRFGVGTRLIVLLNNLGGCSTQETGVLTHDLFEIIGVGRVAMFVNPAPLMTSLNMPGFSVTLLPAEAAYLEALGAPTKAPGWPGVVTPHPVVNFQPVVDHSGSHEPCAQNARVSGAIRRITDAIIDSETELDALDAKVGDGDAGSTFATGARAVRERLLAGTLHTTEPARLATEIGGVLSHIMGGSGGVLLSILFTATGGSLEKGSDWAQALGDGIARMRAYGGASLGDRTMLDALIPATAALPQGAAAAATAARTGANTTAVMKRALAGRSAYVPEASLDGVVDPGAEAVARAFAALAQ